MEKKCKWILELLADFYITIIILIFPLIIGNDGYNNILTIKYYSYLYITVIYIILNILVLLYFLLIKKLNYIKKIKFNKVQIYILIFLIINIISTLFSPYKKYDLFLGLGRGEGLLNIILYCVSFLLISLFYKFNKKHINIISYGVLSVSLIATLQFFGFNILNIFKPGTGPYNMSFMTTLGNKDIISAYYTLLLTINIFSYIFLENNNLFNKIINLISIFLGIFIFFIINVDSGLVAFLSVLLISFPIILLNNKYLSRFMFIGFLTISSLFFCHFTNMTYKYSDFSFKPNFQFNSITILLLVISILFIFSFIYIKNKNYIIKNKAKFLKRIYLLYPILFILSLVFIYFNNLKISILADMKKLLHLNFDDSIGTYRIFLWKRSLTLIQDYPLFGTGPDTFSIRFMSKYAKDVMLLDKRITINDTAANVYLTMLINIGIVGLLSYINFIKEIVIKLFKSVKKNKYALIFVLSIICFLIQDFFNLTVVIITPLFYTVLAISISCIDNYK